MTRLRSPDGTGPMRGWRRAALMISVASIGLATATVGWSGRSALAQTPPAAAPAVAPATQDDKIGQPQLEQLLAPVALYPDELLMQILMAATYPLEVVQAQRWLQQGQNAQLRGDALAQALNAEPWDPSVKSLVTFPDVVKMMNDQLEWTQQVGDALLAQQDDVLNTVQVLRSRAQAAGHLQSGPQQTVTVNTNVSVPPPAPGGPAPIVAPPQQTIVIQPAQPDTVYVPAYNPNVVYGTWPYPAYPPPYYPPPVGWGLGSALLTGMAFAGGVALVGSLWGWASPGWGRGDVNINASRYNNINVNRNQISGNSWRHDVNHRGGVAYNNQDVRNRYRGDNAPGGGAANRAQSREQFRGRMDQVDRGGRLTDGAPGDRGNLGDRGGPGDRQGPGDRGGPGDRQGLGDRGGPGERQGLGDRGGPGDRQGLGDRGGPGDRQGLGDRGGPGDRQGLGGAGDRGLGDRGPGGAQRPNAPGSSLADRGPDGAQRPGGAQRPAQQRPSGAQRPAPQRPQTAQAPSGRPQVQQRPAQQQRAAPAFQGANNGAATRAAAQRGATSRQAPAAPRAAPRGGGGGGGGGGGRRR